MRKKQSKILAAVLGTAKGLHAAGAIDRVTMREFDKLCIVPVAPLRPAEIKRIREGSHVSQAVFAALLNTSVSTVQKWEVGQKSPTGTALKLLHLVQKNGLDSVA
ncbi:MAG: DNA-binding transcriptional regulator [Steroidobacteraceae bacterium]